MDSFIFAKSIFFKENIKKNVDLTYELKVYNACFENEYEQKQDIIGEDFRLLYVAITRAKRRLHISVAKKDKHFGRMQTVVPSIIFDELL